MNENKIRRPTPLEQINKLITWYETNKPRAGQVIPVSLSPEQLARALGRPAPIENGRPKPFPKQQPYRGRMLEAVK